MRSSGGYGILEQGRSCRSSPLNVRSVFWSNRGCSMQDEERIASWTGCSGWMPPSWKGRHLKAGAVASIEGIVHPITAARLVMEETNHVLLVGPFAGKFARHFKLDRHRSTGAPRRLSYDRILAKAETFNNRTARDRRRCRLGSVRDGGGRGLDRGYRFDVAGAGWRQPAHRLWSLRGQSEWCCVDDGHRRRHHPPCDRQEYLRSSGYGEEPCGRRSTGVADARVSDPWVGWGLSPLAGRAICHQACDAPYGCGLVERDRPADRSRTISMKDALFHLAFPTHDVAAAKRFYVDGLGCTLGRESSHAVMFGLAGHQLVAHLTTEPPATATRHLSPPFRSGLFCRKIRGNGSWNRPRRKSCPSINSPASGSPAPASSTTHSFSKIPPGTCSSSNTTRMSRRFSASETIVRSATRCNLPPAPEPVGSAECLALVLSLALTLALVLAGEIGEIPE